MLKLYGFPFAPNPRKVFTYMMEKRLPFAWVAVDIPSGEHRSDWFRAKNPMAGLPVLELEDGTCLAESLAIIEYLEDLHPEPTLLGTTPMERYHARSMERLCEMSLLLRVGRIFRNAHPMFAGPGQIPQLADQAREELPAVLAIVDAMIGDAEFVAGAHPSVADCTLWATCVLAETGGIEIDPAAANIARWRERWAARPSAAAPA